MSDQRTILSVNELAFSCTAPFSVNKEQAPTLLSHVRPVVYRQIYQAGNQGDSKCVTDTLHSSFIRPALTKLHTQEEEVLASSFPLPALNTGLPHREWPPKNCSLNHPLNVTTYAWRRRADKALAMSNTSWPEMPLAALPSTVVPNLF